MSRAFALGMIAFFIVGVLLDPYTLHRSASDVLVQARWWQVALAGLDLALLVTAGLLLWQGRAIRTFSVLTFEALFTLLLSVGYVRRDGLSRFAMGFGATEYLSIYLVLIGSRFVLLASVGRWILRRAPPA